MRRRVQYTLHNGVSAGPGRLFPCHVRRRARGGRVARILTRNRRDGRGSPAVWCGCEPTPCSSFLPRDNILYVYTRYYNMYIFIFFFFFVLFFCCIEARKRGLCEHRRLRGFGLNAPDYYSPVSFVTQMLFYTYKSKKLLNLKKKLILV